MNQEESEASEPEKNIKQQVDNSTIYGGMQAANGDGTVQFQVNGNVSIEANIRLEQRLGTEIPEQLKLKSFWQKVCNYLKTLLFLIVALVTWFFLGFTATHAFPSSLVESLIGCLFSGFKIYKVQVGKAVEESIKSAWQTVRLKLHDIPTPESVVATGSKREARELNRLDSEYWLLTAAIELLSANISPSDRNLVDWKLSEIDERRDLLSERLQPLKSEHFKLMNRLQETWKSCYEFFSLKAIRQEKENKKVERILSYLVVSYAGEVPSSREVIQGMLEVLDEEITKYPRLKTLREAWRLLNWTYSYTEYSSEGIREDPKYEEFHVRARQESLIYHILGGCWRYPRVERAGDDEIIRFFKAIEDAEAEKLKICKTCQRIFSR